ncbi:MAG: DUF1295 domain-containing protein [Bacteroidales bacterium]|nr:DUF1295 domain-containing protein [Bacteroidales bacterium]
MSQILQISGITIFSYMVMLYLIAQRIHNNSIVDIAWGFGFVITTLVLIFTSEIINASMLILSFMILLWGSRLSFYIFIRNAGKPEDFRYANWRKDWGKRQPLIAFFKVFMLQGVIMWIIALPIYAVFAGSDSLPATGGLIGIIIFLSGFAFEVIADSQMKKFRENPVNKGKLISSGLWNISRHPNYFGEAALWWGIGIYAFFVSGNWFVFISPLIMSLLLRYVSGVPLLEEKYKNRPDFIAYAEKTSVFVPYIGKRKIS